MNRKIREFFGLKKIDRMMNDELNIKKRKFFEDEYIVFK